MELDELLSDLVAKKVTPASAPIPTGSLGLDLALGGGYRRGSIAELSGDSSSYKSVFALHTVAQAQKFGPVLWLDSGEEFRPDVARRLGVNLDLLRVGYPLNAHRALDAIRVAAEDYSLIVLDSASGLDCDDPEFDIVRWLWWLKEDISFGATALFISNEYATRDQVFPRELRKWSAQQVRMIPNGKRLVEAKVIRNAVARPVNYRMSFRFDLAGGFDREYELVRLGEETGVIEVRGSWGYFNGFKLGNGVNGCVGTLRNDPGYAQEIREAIREVLA